MRKFQSIEWLLLCLIIGAFIAGIVVAMERRQNSIAFLKGPRYPTVALCN